MLLDIVLWIAVLGALASQNLRWLRVAQRDEYAGNRVVAMVKVWHQARPVNWIIAAVAVVGIGVGLCVPGFTFLGLAALIIWPWWLPIQGVSAKLNWTARLKRLTTAVLGVQLALLVACWRPERAALVVLLAVLIIAAICFAMTQVENKLAHKYVVDATAKLGKIRPTIVAITGSYGKTSTKLYTNQLLARSMVSVASPASFNNLMGLSRTVNDRLNPGTEVFIAEMGTYGPGDIRELCDIFAPTIACITTIGEAHMERMKDRATIVAAKTEITEKAPEVVLNVDVPELAALADQLDPTKRVMRVSATPGAKADVIVHAHDGVWTVTSGHADVGEIPAPEAGHPINLAVAVAIGVLLDVPLAVLASQMRELPSAAHRAELQTTPSGIMVFDDTYNSNPDGAHTALAAALNAAGPSGRVFTVTPGMVELGSVQAARNMTFAREATARDNATLFVVGYTNKRALMRGAANQPGRVRWFPTRQLAAASAMTEAKSGDAILFENDLPDHYA